MARFRFAGTVSGREMTLETFIAQDTESFNVGDIVNLESGYIDPAATADTALVGVVVGADDPDDETAAGLIAATTNVTKIKVITNWDAIYKVADANIRLVGATLDITGGTGSQTLTTSSNTEFVVVKTSTASEDTEVMLTPAAHYLAST